MFHLCTIHEGKPDPLNHQLILTVEFAGSKLQAGQVIYLRENHYTVQIYEILKISKPFWQQNYEVILRFMDPVWMWTERLWLYIINEDEKAICGIAPDNIRNFNPGEQEKTAKLMVEKICEPSLGQRILAHLKWGLEVDVSNEKPQDRSTKWGGLPFAAAEMKFPLDENGNPALFIGQINLEIKNEWQTLLSDLPARGILYIFGTIEEEDGYYSFDEIKLIYCTGTNGEMIPVPLPAELQNFGCFAEREMEFAPSLFIPDWESSIFQNDETAIAEKHQHWYVHAILRSWEGGGQARLLGHPCQIQGCVMLEAEMKHSRAGWYGSKALQPNETELTIEAFETKAEDWVQLFSLDASNQYFRQLSSYSDSFNEYMDGRFYVMIRKEDLRNAYFAETVTIYQCT